MKRRQIEDFTVVSRQMTAAWERFLSDTAPVMLKAIADAAAIFRRPDEQVQAR